MIFYSFSVFDKKIKPTVLAVSEVHARYIASAAINKVVYDQVKKGNLKYEDLVTLQVDNDGKVTALQANILKMNEIKSDMALLIQEKISNIGTSQIKIPIGAMMNIEVLSSLGPNVPIKMIPIGSANTDFASSFNTAGINQTRHQITLIAKSRIRVLLPVMSADATVETTIPIAETIIVGNVPQQYFELQGDVFPKINGFDLEE
jgi:sporulation protein YunB